MNSDKDDFLIKAILDAITAIKRQSGYGSIEITLHDGRVTQIESREKVRFEHRSNLSKN